MDTMDRVNEIIEVADKYCRAFAIGVILGSVMIGGIMLNDYIKSPKPEKKKDD